MRSKDWAVELIEDMRTNHIADIDEATRNFCAAYKDGDSLDALDAFWATAEKVYDVENETLVLFRDGSVYVSWEQGLNHFYLDIATVIEQYPDEIADLGLEG